MSENDKLVTLANSAMARTASKQGAAVRDITGRTYVATEVSLSALTLDALEVALAQAISSGVEGIEAFFVCGQLPSERALAFLQEFSAQAEQVLL